MPIVCVMKDGGVQFLQRPMFVSVLPGWVSIHSLPFSPFGLVSQVVRGTIVFVMDSELLFNQKTVHERSFGGDDNVVTTLRSFTFLAPKIFHRLFCWLKFHSNSRCVQT